MTRWFLTRIVWVGLQAGFLLELPSDRLTLPCMMSRRLCCLFIPRSIFISISFCKGMVKNLGQRIRAHITTALVFPGVLLQNVFILSVKTLNNQKGEKCKVYSFPAPPFLFSRKSHLKVYYFRLPEMFMVSEHILFKFNIKGIVLYLPFDNGLF